VEEIPNLQFSVWTGNAERVRDELVLVGQLALREVKARETRTRFRCSSAGRDPRLSTIVRLARGLKIAPAELLDGVR